MTVFTVFLILATLLLPLLFFNRQNQGIAALMFLCCAIHCIATFVQNEFLKSVTADAHLYYFDLEGYTARSLELGTSSIVYLTQFIKNGLNFEFVEAMYLYGMAGAAAILLLLRWISLSLNGYVQKLGCLLCFIPGLHFWTSSIGKDALVALGLTLVTIGFQSIRSNIFAIAFGGMLCLMIRPHIFLIVMASFPIAKTLSNKSFNFRVFSIIVLLATIPMAQFIIQMFLGINLLSFDDVSGIFSERQSYVQNTLDHGVIYIENPAGRILYFTFNPLFYNAESALAIVASVENLVIIGIFARLLMTFRKIEASSGSYRLFLILSVVGILVFTGLAGFNLGLALRQKVMFYPALIILFLICEANYAQRRQQRRGQSFDVRATPY